MIQFLCQMVSIGLIDNANIHILCEYDGIVALIFVLLIKRGFYINIRYRSVLECRSRGV